MPPTACLRRPQAAGIKVSLLINNAGVGGHGKFYERKLPDDHAMMQLNMGALVSLTHLYLEAMVQRGSREGVKRRIDSRLSFPVLCRRCTTRQRRLCCHSPRHWRRSSPAPVSR